MASGRVKRAKSVPTMVSHEVMISALWKPNLSNAAAVTFGTKAPIARAEWPLPGRRSGGKGRAGAVGFRWSKALSCLVLACRRE
jgi:hypothetical protein